MKTVLNFAEKKKSSGRRLSRGVLRGKGKKTGGSMLKGENPFGSKNLGENVGRRSKIGSTGGTERDVEGQREKRNHSGDRGLPLAWDVKV